MNKVLKNKKAIFIFTAPAAVMFLSIMLIPIVCAIVLAFCDWNSIGTPRFIGAGNFVEMFAKDKTMRIAIRNSLFIVIFSLVTQQSAGLLIAAALSARGTKFRNFFKNIYYMPCVISSAALALLFSFLFNPNMGINALLKEFGIQGPLWLMDVSFKIPLGLWVIGFVAAWQYTGSSMMLYMAAIAGIPDTYYDAAEIDGADPKKIKNI